MSLENIIEQNKAVLAYFSTEECNVCKVLKPKVKELLQRSFENIHFEFIDSSTDPETSGQYSVFTAPTILVFFEGKEYFRYSRYISIDTLEADLSRIYEMVFG